MERTGRPVAEFRYYSPKGASLSSASQNLYSEDNHEPELLHTLRYIPNLENISSSLKSDNRIRTYDPKTTLEASKSFNPNRAANTPPTDITLRGVLDKSSIPALRVMSNHLKLRGSAAPEPKNAKNHARNGPENRKFFIFRPPPK